MQAERMSTRTVPELKVGWTMLTFRPDVHWLICVPSLMIFTSPNAAPQKKRLSLPACVKSTIWSAGRGVALLHFSRNGSWLDHSGLGLLLDPGHWDGMYLGCTWDAIGWSCPWQQLLAMPEMWNLPKDQPRPFLRPAILHQIPATQLRFGSDHGELVLRGHVRGKPCKAGVNSTMLLFKQAGVRPVSMALTSNFCN